MRTPSCPTPPSAREASYTQRPRRPRRARESLTLLLTTLALQTLAAGGLSAQGQVEVGFDGGVVIDGDGTDAEALTIALPLESIRMGFHLGRSFSLEMSLGGSRVKVLDAPSTTRTSLGFGVSGLYHFGPDIDQVRFHVLAGVPWRYRSVSDDSDSLSDSEFGVSAGVGLTLPFAEAWAMRLQSRAVGWSGSETQLAFLIGLSLLLG